MPDGGKQFHEKEREDLSISIYTGVMSVFFLITYYAAVPGRSELPFMQVLAVIAAAAFLTAAAVWRGAAGRLRDVTFPLIAALSFLMCGFALWPAAREAAFPVVLVSLLECAVFAVIGGYLTLRGREEM